MRSRGAVLLAGAVLVGLAGASAGLFGDLHGAERRSPLLGRIAFDVAVGVLLAYVVVVFGLTVWAVATSSPESRRLPERQRRTGLELIVLILIVLAASAGLARLRQAEEPTQPRDVEEADAAAPEPAGDGDDPTSGTTDALVIGLVAAGLLAGLTVYLVGTRRRTLDVVDERSPAAGPLAAAAAAAAADLRLEDDPRRAVVAAYLRMDAHLAEHGFGRRPSEAPLEHLARVLDDAGIPPAPSGRLVELFERARFSSHPVDRAMRDEALAHLETVRDHLAPAPG